MSKQFAETHSYSARIQEAMRYNKLPSSVYSLAMNILNAVSRGYTEEQWSTEQSRTVQALVKQPVDKNAPHTDAENRYEQMVLALKDLSLWPW